MLNLNGMLSVPTVFFIFEDKINHPSGVVGLTKEAVSEAIRLLCLQGFFPQKNQLTVELWPGAATMEFWLSRQQKEILADLFKEACQEKLLGNVQTVEIKIKSVGILQRDPLLQEERENWRSGFQGLESIATALKKVDTDLLIGFGDYFTVRALTYFATLFGDSPVIDLSKHILGVALGKEAGRAEILCPPIED